CLDAQVLNGGFEEWTNGVPDHWYLVGHGSAYGIERSSHAHSGQYAVKIFIHFTPSRLPSEQGIFMFGSINNQDSRPHGFRIPNGSNALSFWYQCNASSNVNPNFQCVGHSVFTAAFP